MASARRTSTSSVVASPRWWCATSATTEPRNCATRSTRKRLRPSPDDCARCSTTRPPRSSSRLSRSRNETKTPRRRRSRRRRRRRRLGRDRLRNRSRRVSARSHPETFDAAAARRGAPLPARRARTRRVRARPRRRGDVAVDGPRSRHGMGRRRTRGGERVARRPGNLSRGTVSLDSRAPRGRAATGDGRDRVRSPRRRLDSNGGSRDVRVARGRDARRSRVARPRRVQTARTRGGGGCPPVAKLDVLRLRVTATWMANGAETPRDATIETGALVVRVVPRADAALVVLHPSFGPCGASRGVTCASRTIARCSERSASRSWRLRLTRRRARCSSRGKRERMPREESRRRRTDGESPGRRRTESRRRRFRRRSRRRFRRRPVSSRA